MQRTERQLLVMAALAAVNHGLTVQAQQILAAFPELIPDRAVRAVCQAMVLLGLEQPVAALNCLIGLNTPEGLALRQLILTRHPTAGAEAPSHCGRQVTILP